MVETEDLAGYRVGRVLDKMGMTAQDTAELFFEDVRVPADCLLGGEEGKGMHQLMGDLPYERLTIAVGGVAAMEGAVAETVRYVNERKAFGQSIASFQNTRFKLAEIVTQDARRADVRRPLHRAAGEGRRSTRRRPRWPSGGSPTCSRK